MITPTLRDELEAIRLQNGGELRPPDVFKWAKAHKGSALHSRVFLKSDAAIAYEARLDIIRDLIRVHVVYMAGPRNTAHVKVPEYYSPSPSRGLGGYRPIVQIMGEDETRHQVLLDTLTRLMSVREAWLFDELQGVTRAIEAARDKLMPKPVAKAS